MATRGDVAVIVLAAGSGTRMRSDIPKVLHPLAGRSMLSHVLHAVANVSPQHLAVVVSKERNQLARAIAELVDQIGQPVDIAVQEEQLGTGHAVGCGLSALPSDFDGTIVVTAGDVPMLDADTLAELVIAPRRGTCGRDGAHDEGAGPDRIRPHPPHAGRRGHRHRRAGGRHPAAARIREVNAGVYAFDAALRSALRRLRSDNAQAELYLTDAIEILRRDDMRCGRNMSTTARSSRASTTGFSWPNSPPNSTAASLPPTSAAGSP